MRALKIGTAFAIALLTAWSYSSPDENILRDLALYNLIWLFSLILLIAAPVTVDRVAVATLSLAIFIWGIGSLITSAHEFLSSFNTFQALPHIAYILFYPLVLLAMQALHSKGRRLEPLEILDALILTLGLTSVAAAILFITLLRDLTLGTWLDYLQIFYPIGDLALLAFSLLHLMRSGYSRGALLLVLGISIFAGTDIYYLWLNISGKYQFGSMADIGWLVAIFIAALSCHMPSKISLDKKMASPSLIALSIFLSPLLLALSALQPELIPHYLLLPAIANLLLAFIRMDTALRHSRTLNEERLLARTDELTGLANRRRLISEMSALSDRESAVLLLDLNGFKPINDQYGHEMGDQILREVSRRFVRTLPPSALLARLGGDEFGVITYGSAEENREVAYALRACLTYPLRVNRSELHVGVSIGFVQNDGRGDLLKRADEAMYRAKRSDEGVVQS